MVDAPAMRGVNKIALQKAIQLICYNCSYITTAKIEAGLASAMKHSNETIVGRDVRYWHLADIPSCTAHVRFRSKSGHAVLRCKCLLMTQSGHLAGQLNGDFML